jgi:hypothetical protein
VPQPVVEVQDASGNPVEQAGVAVTASIASGDAGATLSNASANTAANGRASFAGLAINGLTGPYVLRFATGALTQINANSITLTAGPAASIEFSAGGSSGNAGDEVTPDPAVIVKDASGNPVEGVPVQFQVTSAEGTVDPTTPVITGPDGIATVTSWILGPTPSTENTLTATVNGLSGSVLFTITTGP